MKFIWYIPLGIASTLSMIGMMWYLIAWHYIPEYMQNAIKEHLWIFIVFTIPFLIWAGIGKTDKEYEKERELYKKRDEQNKSIMKKYEDMEDLKK